ncbi:MAG: hypothetical protein ACI8TX_001766 [Hyphomicrobiaceae bacterium]
MSILETGERRAWKRDALFDEHRTISSFVEREVAATAVLRAWCATAWAAAVIALGTTGASVLTFFVVTLTVVAVFWLVDFFFSFYGVVYKMRRLQVRDWIDRLPIADIEEIDRWKSPENPFLAITRAQKKRAMRDTITSPAVQGAYALLVAATLILLFV